MKKLTALLLLLPVFASADPGSATRFLMTEPASLFDLGMLRLALNLRIEEPVYADYFSQTANTKVKYFHLINKYKADTDEIIIAASVTVEEPISNDACWVLLDEMRSSPFLSSRVFRHVHEDSDTDNRESYDNVDKRFRYVCAVRVGQMGESHRITTDQQGNEL